MTTDQKHALIRAAVAIARDVPEAHPVDIARLLCGLERAERAGNRYACQYCNGEIQSEAYESATARVESRLAVLAQAIYPAARAEVGGDPRGLVARGLVARVHGIPEAVCTDLERTGLACTWGGR